MTSTIEEISEKEESIEQLLEEIINTVEPSSSSSSLSEEKIPSFLFSQKRWKVKEKMVPLILSLTILGGILLGTMFGYYWGKHSNVNLETLDAKFEFIINEIKSLRQAIQPDFPSDEIIQPLELPEKGKALA